MEFDTLAEQGEAFSKAETSEWKAGVTVDIRPMGCREYDRKIRELTMLRREDLRGGKLSDAETEEMNLLAAAYGLVESWDGFTRGGEPLSYTPDLGVQAFKANYPFYKWVVTQATQLRARYDAIDEGTEGNSEGS